MDWDLKMPLWDLAELDRHAEPNLGSMVDGPSSGSALRCPVNGLECSVDLKLGGLGDPGSSYKWNEQPRISAAVVATSAPSKRQRTSGDGSQVASCLVDGCKADLSKLRDYHRRHKVCEVHSKTPVVLVHGQEQRFCQQCSRFHMLAEFDEVKRSCRKRLDGHNRRRRKPQPNSVISGTRLMSAYPAQVFQSATTEPNWPPVIKIEDNARCLHQPGPDLLYRNPFFHNSSLSYSRERKHLPFLQESETSLSSITTIGSLVGRAHLMTSVPSGIGGGGCSSSSRSQMSATGVAHAFHSDGAFSLLSSPRQASSIDVSRIMQSAHQICVGQPLVSSSEYGDLLHYSHSAAAAADVASSTGYSCSGMGDAGAGAGRTALVSSARNGADAQCSLFRMGEGGSPDGASQALPFSWQQ